MSDLTNGWNFEFDEDRKRAWKLIKETQPYIVIGSPPCTMFSNLQQLSLHAHRHDPQWLDFFAGEEKKAVAHIDFCMLLYRCQMRNGRHFLHERPWGASSWKLDSVVEILNDEKVWVAQTDMCRFGMTSHIHEKGRGARVCQEAHGFYDQLEGCG